MPRRCSPLVLVVALPVAAAAAAPVVPIPFRDIGPILQRFTSRLPEGLAGRSASEIEHLWPGWVEGENKRVRERVRQGDEDSLVNLWLFGTSFTREQPARAEPPQADSTAQFPDPAGLERRLEDLLQAVRKAPQDPDPRLQFARDVLEASGIDLSSADGLRRAREHLRSARARILEENRRTAERLARARRTGGTRAELEAHGTIFDSRGLSPDTSILSSFAIDQGLAALARSGAIEPGGVHRAAIVGPGLDIVNKADGHDFYPEQSIQPFAVIDSLRRLGLASPGLDVSTFDVSPRVNAHLRAAVSRATDGYLVHLPLGARDAWTLPLLRYWESWGSTVGAAAPPVASADDPELRLRAVRVDGAVVATVHPMDLNIVVERQALAEHERYDLIVATNVFVYYDPFEQALATANVSSMLRPGGSLLSNTSLDVAPPMRGTAGYITVPYSDRQFDRLFWYQREP